MIKLDEYRPRLMDVGAGDKTQIIEIPATGFDDPTIADMVSDCVRYKYGIYAFGQKWTYVDAFVVKQRGEKFIRIFVKEDTDA